MGEHTLGDALRKFLNQSHLKGSIQALQIEEVWEKIMGKTVARYTDKIRIHGKTLYIDTAIARRVNEALGEVVISEVVIK